NKLRVVTPLEYAVRIEDVGRASGHAGAEVPPRRAENGNHSRRHVFAAVVSDAFDYRQSPAVSNRKSFAHAAREEQPSAGSPIENGIPRDDVLMTEIVQGVRRRNDNFAAGHPFADVIVGFSLEGELHPVD